MTSAPYLALDLGLRRTGVAFSESGLIASPLLTLSWEPPHLNAHVADIVREVVAHGIATIIIGTPLGEDESETSQSERIAPLITALRDELARSHAHVAVVLVNEFHSTQDALSQFPGVDKDAAAAAVILQDYLDSTR